MSIDGTKPTFEIKTDTLDAVRSREINKPKRIIIIGKREILRRILGSTREK